MSNIFKKLKNWTFDVLGFVFFVLLEMFLYLIEVIDFFAKIRRPLSSDFKKKEQQCKTDMQTDGTSPAGIARTPSMPIGSSVPTVELGFSSRRKTMKN